MAAGAPMTTERAAAGSPGRSSPSSRVVLLANGTMIWLAFATWTGLETDGAYQKGLAYNRTLEAAAAQAALGWRVELALEQQGERACALELHARGPPRQPDRGGARSRRPSSARPTRATTSGRPRPPRRRPIAPSVALPLAGQWDVRLRPTRGRALPAARAGHGAETRRLSPSRDDARRPPARTPSAADRRPSCATARRTACT